MDYSLIRSIRTTIENAVSAVTDQVYFHYLPDAKLLDHLSIVFELNNNSNSDTFDLRELVKNYRLDVKINCRDLTQFEGVGQSIKTKLYDLQQSDSFNVISLDNADLFFDSELNTYTEFLRFSIS